MENEKAKKSRGKNDTRAHTQISIRLSDELLNQIQRLAEKERRKNL
jgi:hypothetical protein